VNGRDGREREIGRVVKGEEVVGKGVRERGNVKGKSSNKERGRKRGGRKKREGKEIAPHADF